MIAKNLITHTSLLFSISYLFFATNCQAQIKEGVATYTMKTELRPVHTELDFDDSSSLFIFSKVGMDTGAFTKSIMSFQDNHLQKGVSVYVPSYDSIGNLIFRNFKSQKIVFRIPDIPPFKAFTVEDKWLPIKWNIEQDFDTINGLKCQKATGYFRGRYYTAWFAIDIPVPYGPWKLFGLPGLIVYAYDKEHVFFAMLDSVCYPCTQLNTPIKQPKEPKEMTLKDYVHFEDHYAEEMVKMANKEFPQGISANNPKSFRTIKDQRKHSFEKIYGWEEHKHHLPPAVQDKRK